jgi:hypothetical protein
MTATVSAKIPDELKEELDREDVTWRGESRLERCLSRGQQSSRRTGDSQLALKSGTLKPKRGFTAYPDGFEAEFTDKPHPQHAEGV